MKTNIYFYLKGKESAELISLYNDANIYQFKKGDKFWFQVNDVYPKTIEKLGEEYNSKFVDLFVNTQREKRENLGHYQYKIVSVYHSVEHDLNMNCDCNYKHDIEYTCKRVKYIYWKFWQTYKFKQFFKNIFKTK